MKGPCRAFSEITCALEDINARTETRSSGSYGERFFRIANAGGGQARITPETVNVCIPEICPYGCASQTPRCSAMSHLRAARTTTIQHAVREADQ